MLKRITVLYFIILLLLSSLPIEINAATFIGEQGSIPAGGSPGPGGVSLVPSFRVGLISETFRVPLNTNKLHLIDTQIKRHYANHVPVMTNSIIFSPYYANNPYDPEKSVWLPYDKCLIGWYNASQGNFELRSTSDQKKHRKLYEDKSKNRSKNIFYQALLNQLGSEKFEFLANGKWKEVYDSIGDSIAEEQSSYVWNWIFDNWNKNGDTSIEKAIKDYTFYIPFSNTSTYDEQLKNQVGYLDLLMTIYALSPDKQKKWYHDEIERYIKGIELSERPPLIAIDTVMRVYAPNYNSKRIFIPSHDYIMYIGGITPSYRFNKTDTPSGPKLDYDPSSPTFVNETNDLLNNYSTRTIMKNLVNLSMKQAPNRSRITNLVGDSYKNNGFAWGQSGVSGWRLRTYTGAAQWETSSIIGVMESLYFCKDQGYYGFMIVGADNLIPKVYPTGSYSLIINPDKEVLEGGSTEIGKKTPIFIKGVLNSDEITKWNKAFEHSLEKGFPKIKISLNSLTLASGQADTSPNPYPLETKHKYKGNGQWIDTNKDELMAFLNEGIIEYYHDISKYKVAPDTSYTFNYKATVEIKLGKNPNDLIVLEGCPSQADKTYHIPVKEDRYTSVPSTYSEIKQGSPNHETFEAMAGTPTTRHLYFASGGSEFIVDIISRWNKDIKTVRTYKSYYSGTPSEFKLGDQAEPKNVPSPSGASNSDTLVDVTYGKDLTVSATWQGSIPNNASSVTVNGSGSVSATCKAQPDYSAYNTAKSQAQAWVSAVNGTTISHTAASDGITRSFNSWGASITTDSDNPPKDTTESDSFYKTVSDGDGGTKQVATKGSVTASPDGPGNYTITVKGSVPANIICGPDFDHDLEGIEDTWTQEITYDIQKIEKVSVWKIDRSHVDGMSRLLGTDQVTATIVQGNPNIFYNIAKNDTSKDGRIRYSLEPQQHDTVEWYEGVRSNASDGLGTNPDAKDKPGGGGHNEIYAKGIIYQNNKKDKDRIKFSNELNFLDNNTDKDDKNSDEYTRFEERRNMNNVATVISDFVILQTSSGDQSVLYFEKSSESKKAYLHFNDMQITKEEMWDINPLSAGQWKPEDINMGSYYGIFHSPSTKYIGTGNKHHVATIFDNDPAHSIVRPNRPSAPLMLMETDLDVIDTIPNGEYLTGHSTVFYEHILDYDGPTDIYNDTFHTDYGSSGLTEKAPYSRNHSKVNDIVIHNPVSTQDAMVISVDASMDQRSSGSLVGGNLQSDIEEYVTRLKQVHPYQNFIINGDADEVTTYGSILNWYEKTSDYSGVTFTRRTSPDWKINGTGSFEIRVPAYSNREAKYVCETVGEPNTSYTFSGKIGAHRVYGFFTVEALDAYGQVLDTWKTSPYNKSSITTQMLNLKTPANTTQLRVSIVNGNSNTSSGSIDEYVFADDLELIKAGGDTSEWVPLKYTAYQQNEKPNPDYVAPYTIANVEYVPEHTIPNPEYIAPVTSRTDSFEYTGSHQTYTAPVTGSYTLEVWGAQGGGTYGGKGGYSKGTVSLNKGDTLYIVVGGQGGQTTSSGTSISGGYNGGGTGHGDWYTAGGGGATHIANRNGQLQSLSSYRSSIMIVAGGGGGQGSNSSSNAGGDGGGTSGGSGSGGWEGGGASQSSGGYSHKYSGSFGKGGNAYGYDMDMDVGGGGGGYYGGGGAGGDSGSSYDAGGGGGSGYIGGVTNGTMQSGVRSSHGLAKITSPQIAGNSEPEFITIPAQGNPTITINNAHYVPAVLNSNNDLTPAEGLPWIDGLEPTIPTIVCIDKTVTSPPDSWYETILVTTPANPNVTLPGLGNVNSAKFLTLDSEFKVFFPNEGDFYGNGALGLSTTTSQRGKGFMDSMDTTEWTARKLVSFEFNVIYDGTLYPSGSEISLPVNQRYYDFYIPLGNKEAISAEVEFTAIANNGHLLDNSNTTNRARSSNKKAKHSAFRKYNIDLIGRIGNLVMEDTGDFRFSNLFKQALMPTKWFIPNVIPKVAVDEQNKILGSSRDIRGKVASSSTHYLNTYGLLSHLEQAPLSFPLSPSINTIAALHKQPLRFGYPLFIDIQTIGNYYSNLQIIPYYYKLDLSSGAVTPVDVYMEVDKEYEPINLFGAAVPGWNTTSVYDEPMHLNWEEEAPRRNFYSKEQAITEYVRDNTYNIDSSGNDVPIGVPIGQYHVYGNAQILYPNERNRTFIGTSHTYGEDKNPGNVLSEYQFNQQAQRWHFSLKLPSSAIFVPHGAQVSKVNMDSVMNNTSVIVTAADIKAIGDTYVLEYQHPDGNGNVVVAGKTFNLNSIPYSVLAVYSSEKSSAYDLETTGTH